jgi:hypothetical protein
MELLILRRLNVKLLNKTPNMKKIFFIFTMLLMSVVSVWAEELNEDLFMDGYTSSYDLDHFTISGENGEDLGGFLINGDNRITISAKNGEKITKVEYGFYWEDDADDEYTVKATKGNIDCDARCINDINDTSLDIYTENASGILTIDYIVVYYKENNDPFVDEYVKIEDFATTTGSEYTGTNINVTGVGNGSNGLSIGNGNTVTIGSNDNISLEISRVDLEFGSNVNGASLNSSAGGAVDGEGKIWSISNINSSSTKISLTSGNGYIKNIKVYYVEVPEESEENTVSFITKSGQKYSKHDIIVTGTSGNSYGLRIDNGESVTIASDNGAEILKVDLHFAFYQPDTNTPITSSVGKVSGSSLDWSINDVNSTSLTISHPGVGNSYQVQIENITVYYKERLAPSTIEVAARKAQVAYWATFYSGIANYQAPGGTRVYKVNFDGSTITTTEIEDRIVTKGQGVVLKTLSTDNVATVNIVMTKTDIESSDDYSGNSLKGTGVAITNPGNAYVLNYKPSAGVGFYRLSSTGTVPANRAYLTSGATVAAAAAAAREFFAFDAAITGIENVNAQDSEDDVKTFDLQGRRVATPAKGVYIVNGKKVIMK